ncbi:MAG: ABC transporter transmembrane domain-containing protein [Phycisphaerae bacterium]
MSEGKTSPNSLQDETSIETLPESLQRRFRADLDGQSADLCAPVDLDRQGNYTETYLVLADERLGYYVSADGQWQADWTPLEELSDARVVEGLGLNLLRLLRKGRVEREFRYTMRHARAVAKLHRELERRLGKEDAEEEPATEASAAHLEEKKVRCENCGQVIPAWAETCPRCTSRRKILLRLLDYVKPYRHRALTGFGLALSLTAVGLIQPALLKPLVNEGLGAAPGVDPHYPTVLKYVGIMAALLVFSTVGRMLQMRLIFGLGTLVSRDIRSSVYRHLHKLSLSFFGKKQTGSLVTRVTSDVERIWRFIAFMFVDIIISILTIAGVGVGLFVINWRLAMYALMPVPVMFVLMVIFHRMLHRIFRRMWHRFSQMTAVIADALPGVRVIKAFGQERREVGRFEGRNDALMQQEMTFISSWTFFGPTMMFCSARAGSSSGCWAAGGSFRAGPNWAR